MASHKSAFLRKRGVSGQKIGARNAITVKKNDVTSRRREDCFIADLRQPESFVSLPHVPHNPSPADFMLTNQRRGRLIRAVIGNNDFEAVEILIAKRTKYKVQRVRSVVRGYDDADFNSFCGSACHL